MNEYRNQAASVQEYTVDLEAGKWSSPSVAVIETVADLSDREIESLDPLYKSVDPDALDEICGHENDTSTGCRLVFRYHGYRIELTGRRELRFTPVEKLEYS